MEVKDVSVIDVEAMKEISGVAGYFSKSGQHQVILGTGFVNKVCAEFQKLAGVKADHDEIAETGDKQKLSFQSTTKMISDIFIPIITSYLCDYNIYRFYQIDSICLFFIVALEYFLSATVIFVYRIVSISVDYNISLPFCCQ